MILWIPFFLILLKVKSSEGFSGHCICIVEITIPEKNSSKRYIKGNYLIYCRLYTSHPGYLYHIFFALCANERSKIDKHHHQNQVGTKRPTAHCQTPGKIAQLPPAASTPQSSEMPMRRNARDLQALNGYCRCWPKQAHKAKRAV